MRDDSPRHAQQGLVPDLQALHQPARFLQLAAQRGVLAAAAEAAGVGGVDPQSWRNGRVDLHLPLVFHAPYEHVRDDVFGRARVGGVAGARIQGAQQGDRGLQLLRVATQSAADGGVVLFAELDQAFRREAPRQVQPGRVRREGRELQQEALAQVAGADPQGVEALHAGQYPLHLVDVGVHLRLEIGADFLEAVAQVAVVVDGVDDHRGDDLAVALRQGDVQLGHEVLAQRSAAGVGVVALFVAVVAAGAAVTGGVVRHVGVGDVLAKVLARRLLGGGVRVFRRRRLGALLLTFRWRQLEPVVHLEHEVLFERLAQLGLQVEHRQLQQADGHL